MKHRVLSVLLALTFLLSVFMFCTTAFAATGAQDGITAELKTDKTDYVAGESINVTLDVTNTGNLAHNIQTELIIPEGVTLVEGTLKSEPAVLAGGVALQYPYVLQIPAVEVPTTQAPTTQAPTTQAPTTQPGSGDDGPAETGDYSLVIYGMLAAVSLVGLVMLTFGAKLLKQRWFILVLCGALLVGFVGPMAANAADAGNSFEVVEAITIDGTAAEVKAIVTYDLAIDEVVYKSEGTFLWNVEGEKGYWTPSNITYQGQSCTEKTRFEVDAPYYAMLFGGEDVAGKYKIESLFNTEAEQKVLIGRTKDEASLKALELIEKDEWIIAYVDGKIVVTGWYDNTTVAAVEALYEMVTVDAAEIKLSLPIVGKSDYVHANLPDMTAGTFLNGMDSERGAVVLRYNNITEADFNAYADSLVAAGYSLYQENKLTNLGDVNNVSATYVNGEDVVTILYLPYVIDDATDLPTHLADAQKRSFRPDGTEMRIILQSTAVLFPNEEANTYEDLGITPKMHNVNLYNKHADGNDIGQCTIFTLADGSFLVWDGGVAADADQLYRTLKYMNERPDGKIVIAGWFFTHDHGDHTGAISALSASEHASEITVEKVIINHVADNYAWYGITDPLGTSYRYGWAGVYEQIEEVTAKFAQGENFQLVVPHFGQVLNIRNANIEVLFAGEEDAAPVIISNDNACSLVTMITFDNEDTPDRILNLGDHALDATYNFVFPYLSDGPMSCDIVITAHHGLGGGTSKLYPICGTPEVAIWCTTWRSARGEVTNLQFLFDRSQNKALRNSVKVDIMSDEYVHTLELPFNADEDEVIRTKIGTYKTKFQDAEMDITLLPAFRFQMQWNNADARAKIVSYLKEYAGDVLILPLIDQNSTSYNKADLVAALEEELDYRYVYYAPVWDTSKDASGNFETGDDTMGHLVLSTYPILKAETGILVEGNTTAWANPEGRGFAHVLLDVEGVELDLVATHFNDAGNWTKFEELYEQWGKYTIIAGNTKIKGDGSKVGEGVSSAFAEDVTVLGSEGISFKDSKTDARMSTEGDAYFVHKYMSKIYTTTAVFSLYTAPEESTAPIRQSFVNWWVNSWGRDYASFQKVVTTLKEVNPAVAAFHMVNHDMLGMTEAQVKAELGYPYAIWVPNSANDKGQVSGHYLVSHYPIEDLGILEVTNGSDEAADQYKTPRIFGHALVTINGTEIDIWYGSVGPNAPKQVARLEAAVNATATETGRPFIVSTNDAGSLVGLTSFAGYEVYNYNTPYMANVLVSKGKVTVTGTETKDAAVGWAGVDVMNILDLDIQRAPAIGNWWINRWGNAFDAATTIIREQDLPIITLQQLSNNSIGATAEQVAKETGYEYYYSAEKVHVTETYEINHMILSHYPIDPQEDVVLVDYASGKEGRKFGHVIVDINGTKVDVYFGATDWLSTENLTALEAVVAKVASETGRPFIVSGNDMANEGVTSYAGVEVYNYRTGYVATVMVSKGALEVTKTETIKTSISAGGIDDLNVVYFDTTNGALTPGDPFEPPTEPEPDPEPDPEPEEPAATETVTFLEWWGVGFSKTTEATAAWLADPANHVDIAALVHSVNYTAEQAAALAEAAGYAYHYWLPSEADGSKGPTGHLLLSDYPITWNDTLVLVEDAAGTASPEGRTFAYVTVDVNGTPFDVFFGENNSGASGSLQNQETVEPWVNKHVAAAGNAYVVTGYNFANSTYPSFSRDVYTYVNAGSGSILAPASVTVANGKQLSAGVGGDEPAYAELTFAAAEKAPKEVSLKLMSWGIGRMNGNATYPDQAARWAELLKVIVAENADIIHLHCVNGEAQRDVILADLAAAYPYSVYVSGSASNSQMLLSKYPITSTDTAQISTGENEVRVAGHSIVNVDGTPVEIYFAHLNSPAKADEAAAMVTAFGLPTNDAWFVMGAFHGLDISGAVGEAVNSAVSGAYTIFAPADTVTMVGSKNTTCEYGATGGAFHADACILAEVTFAAAEKAPTTVELNVAVLPASRFGSKFTANKDAIIAAIKSVNADVLAITQIDENVSNPSWWNKADVATQIIEGVKDVYPYAYFAPAWYTVEGESGAFGHLILSKYEIKEYETIVLVEGTPYQTGYTEGRAAGRVLLDVKGVSVDVFFMHTGAASNWDVLAPAILESKADAWVAMGYMNYANIEKSGIEAKLGTEINAAFDLKYEGAWNFINIISGTNAAISNVVRETATFGSFGADPLSSATVTIVA